MVFIYKNIPLPNFKPFAVMTVCKVQECKITTKFNTLLVFAIAFLTFSSEIVHRDGCCFFIVFQMHIPAITSDWARYKKEKEKKSAATEHYLHVQYTVDTS